MDMQQNPLNSTPQQSGKLQKIHSDTNDKNNSYSSQSRSYYKSVQNFSDKRKTYHQRNNNFENKHNHAYHQSYPYNSNSASSKTHRTNSASYFRSYQIGSSKSVNNSKNYNVKKRKMNEDYYSKLHSPNKKSDRYNLFFIHGYPESEDFTNYKQFLNLDLKFMQQSFKLKKNEDNDLLNSVFKNNGYKWNYANNIQMLNILNWGNMMNNIDKNNLGNFMNINNNISNNNNNQTSNSIFHSNSGNNIGENIQIKTSPPKKEQNNNTQIINNLIQHYFSTLQTQQNIIIKLLHLVTDQAAVNNIMKIKKNVEAQITQFLNGKNPFTNASATPNITSQLPSTNNDKQPFNNDLNIQNVLSTYSNEHFFKPYAPILKLTPKNQYLNISTINYQQANAEQNIEIDEKQMELYLQTGKCLKGTIRMNKSHNHAYITVPGLNNDILVKSIKNLNHSLHLDEVVVELLSINNWKPLLGKKNKNIIEDPTPKPTITEDFKTKEERIEYLNKFSNLRPEGKVVKILKSPNKDKEQICKIIVDKSMVYAQPIDDLIPKIIISNNDNNDYKNKYYSIKITGWNPNQKLPKGNIVSEIGSSGDIDVESEVLLRQYAVTEDFSSEVIKEISELKREVDITGREDFRNDLVFTIDPYESKDLDDAINVKVIDDNIIEVGVHIADPTEYVKVGSVLDTEAMNRTTSVYLVQKNIPMLPRILSEDICSIMPNKDTLTLSVIFRINVNTGALDETFTRKICTSVVNSKAKWNYDLVQKIIDQQEVIYDDLEPLLKPPSLEIFNKLVESVKVLHKLTKLVRKQRFDSGSLRIENADINFALDPDTKMPLNFSLSAETDSHNLIEELMLISNKLVAEFLNTKIKGYSLLRRHPFLNDNKINELQRYLQANHINIDFEDPLELNKLLIKYKNEEPNKNICIQRKLKNFMLRAEYVIAEGLYDDQLRHYALNFDLYTHFTSPIRRYPDMIVHRQVKQLIKDGNNFVEENFKFFKTYIPKMDVFNEIYNNAKLISQKSKRIFQCLYIKNTPPKIYDALILDIIYKKEKKSVNVNDEALQIMGGQIDQMEEDDITLLLYVPEFNLEVDWNKENNNNVVICKFDKIKNILNIDYKNSQLQLINTTLKTFESVKVSLTCEDSIPIDVKAILDLP